MNSVIEWRGNISGICGAQEPMMKPLTRNIAATAQRPRAALDVSGMEIADIEDIKPALTQAIRRIVDEIDAAPDSLVEILDLLASLPDDFYPDGRHDSAAFEQREPFE